MFVYRFLDDIRDVVYVGVTKRCIYNRMEQHFSGRGHLEKEQYEKVRHVEYIEVPTISDMTLTEAYFIQKWNPLFNKVKYENFNQEGSLSSVIIESIWKEFMLNNKDETQRKVKKVTFQLDFDIHKRLKLFAIEKDEAMGEIVEKALIEYLEK